MSRMAIFDVPLAELRTRGTIKWQRFEADVIPMFVAEMDAHVAPAVREIDDARGVSGEIADRRVELGNSDFECHGRNYKR